MPRPKNNELHEQMTREARRLFIEKGYVATSYADIAQACGVAKTNVQQHFPAKDRFITDFHRDLLDELDAYLADQDKRTNNYYVNLYHIGQLLFAFLLNSEAMRRFTMEIISDRNLTEIMIDQEVEWATNYEVGFSKEELSRFEDDIAMIMGGIYELLYRKLRNNEVPSPQAIQSRIMTQFAFLRGMTVEEAQALFPADLVSEQEFYTVTQLLQQRLFS